MALSLTPTLSQRERELDGKNGSERTCKPGFVLGVMGMEALRANERSFLYDADCSTPVVRKSCDLLCSGSRDPAPHLSSLPGSYAGPDQSAATVSRRATSCLALLLVGFA
jgi:hypothetical protein